MLVPFQTSGEKPPLYLVHGLNGLMPMGLFLAHSLGSDQPLYAINANGFDGRETISLSVKDMAVAYAKEILNAQPSGLFLIGGMCEGGLVATEVARELQARGRKIGPLILLDPPATPRGHLKDPNYDIRNPRVAAQLYEHARSGLLAQDPQDLPFATHDQERLHLATLAAVNTVVALCAHVPEVFSGTVTAILSFERAAGFFHRQLPWAKLLSRTPTAHVLPWRHKEIFTSGRYDLAGVLKFVLDGAVGSATRAERATKPILASAQ